METSVKCVFHTYCSPGAPRASLYVVNTVATQTRSKRITLLYSRSATPAKQMSSALTSHDTSKWRVEPLLAPPREPGARERSSLPGLAQLIPPWHQLYHAGGSWEGWNLSHQDIPSGSDRGGRESTSNEAQMVTPKGDYILQLANGAVLSINHHYIWAFAVNVTAYEPVLKKLHCFCYDHQDQSQLLWLPLCIFVESSLSTGRFLAAITQMRL